MNLVVIHCDVLCNIVHHLPIQSMKNLLCANKQLFNDRKTLMASNKVLQVFAKRYEMSYFNMLYNSHIETVDVYRPVLKKQYGVSTFDQIYNTQRLLSYLIDPSNDVSHTNYNNHNCFKYYLSTLLMARYPGVSSSKTLNVYAKILFKYKWWDRNVNLYELFEVICLTKNMKYRDVQKILPKITLGKTENVKSFHWTLNMLVSILVHQIDSKTIVVMAYIIYTYIEQSMQYTRELNCIMIDFHINQCNANINMLTYDSSLKLPKYLKTMIYDKLKHVEGLLRNI